MRMTNIHFKATTPHAKCNALCLQYGIVGMVSWARLLLAYPQAAKSVPLLFIRERAIWVKRPMSDVPMFRYSGEKIPMSDSNV